MKNILIFGAGRSSTALISYLLNVAAENNWQVTVADTDVEAARQKIGGHPCGVAVNPTNRTDLIKQSDVVISLLPPGLHLDVAKECLQYNKHIVTASYVTKEMKALDADFRKKGLLFMGEMGLDPGIDHMSAMQTIDRIKNEGGHLTGFRSYCGGLVAPESDDNPWHYKFSWNPRNVVLAGQGTAQYMEFGKLKYIPYQNLFAQYRVIQVPGMGEWEVYANRDSLLYKEAYGLMDIDTLYRGTIRHRGFCDAWNVLVKAGLTDNASPVHNTAKMTYSEFLESFLLKNYKSDDKIKLLSLQLKIPLKEGVLSRIKWLGLDSQKKTGLSDATPAQILETVLLEKWAMKPDDKDMVIMQHEFEYRQNKKKHKLVSTMVIKGEDSIHTAMAKTVGLPLGILVKFLLHDKIKLSGVQIPVMKEVYDPVLLELQKYGVIFADKFI